MDSDVVIALLRAVPEWVYGGLGTLIVIAVQSTISNRQKRKELDHQSREAERERQAALRRDVYLRAAESMARLTGAIGKLADVAIDEQTITGELAEHAPSLVRVNMVGGAEIIRTTSELQRTINRLLMEGVKLREPARAARSESQIAAHWRDKYQAQFDAAILQLQEYSREGVRDEHKLSVLRGDVEFAHEHQEEQSDKAQAALTRMSILQLELSIWASGAMREISAKSLPALVAVRRELGTDEVGDVLEAEMRRSVDEASAGLDAMVAHYRRMLTAMEEAETGAPEGDAVGEGSAVVR